MKKNAAIPNSDIRNRKRKAPENTRVSSGRTSVRPSARNAEKKESFPGPDAFPKEDFKPGTLIYPLPAVLVGCGATIHDYNLITIAWTGILCTDPPVCYISVRPERHSYDLIKKYGEFTINLSTQELAYATDWCGVRSGRDFDKFKECGLHALPGQKVKSPSIGESPLSLECKVRQSIPLGSHEMFIADIVHIRADRRYMDAETGKFELGKSGLLVYEHGHYYGTGREIGHFGWSVRKKKKNGKGPK